MAERQRALTYCSLTLRDRAQDEGTGSSITVPTRRREHQAAQRRQIVVFAEERLEALECPGPSTRRSVDACKQTDTVPQIFHSLPPEVIERRVGIQGQVLQRLDCPAVRVERA